MSKENSEINIRIEMVPDCTKPEVIIRTAEKTPLVDDIVKAIGHFAKAEPSKVTVYDGEKAVLLDQRDIFRVFVEKRRLAVCTSSGRFESHLSLKQFESILDQEAFVRISRFEIVNLSRIAGFDMGFTGTIKITFEDGTETWVARRCVRSIHEKLEALGRGGKDHE